MGLEAAQVRAIACPHKCGGASAPRLPQQRKQTRCDERARSKELGSALGRDGAGTGSEACCRGCWRVRPLVAGVCAARSLPGTPPAGLGSRSACPASRSDLPAQRAARLRRPPATAASPAAARPLPPAFITAACIPPPHAPTPGIVHLVEDEDDYTTASEGSATPRAADAGRLDSGHLTVGGAAGAASRRPSSRGGGSGAGSLVGSPGQARTVPVLQQSEPLPQQGAQQQRRGSTAGEEGVGGGSESGEEGEEPRQRSGWNILGGVPFLPRVLELLTPKATDEDEEGEEDEEGRPGPQAAPTSPGGSSLYPTLAEAEARPRADDEDLQGTTTDAAPLEPGQQPLPALSEASSLMSEDHIRALAAAVPARYRQARWALLYSTARDGISLQTLLRNAGRRAPTVLVVRDFQR